MLAKSIIGSSPGELYMALKNWRMTSGTVDTTLAAYHTQPRIAGGYFPTCYNGLYRNVQRALGRCSPCRRHA